MYLLFPLYSSCYCCITNHPKHSGLSDMHLQFGLLSVRKAYLFHMVLSGVDSVRKNLLPKWLIHISYKGALAVRWKPSQSPQLFSTWVFRWGFFQGNLDFLIAWWLGTKHKISQDIGNGKYHCLINTKITSIKIFLILYAKHCVI